MKGFTGRVVRQGGNGVKAAESQECVLELCHSVIPSAVKKEMGFPCTEVRIMLSVDVFYMDCLFYSLLKG